MFLLLPAVLAVLCAAPARATAAPRVGVEPFAPVLAATSNINDRTDCSPKLCLSLSFDGFFGYNVKQTAAWITTDRRGHFEFFGPGGHIANSVDRVWRRNEYFEINGLWTGNEGALWCARFWVYNTATKHWDTISGNYCIAAGS
jgi:hypothetical protein